MTAELVELDTVSAHWQLALDATDYALTADGKTLPADELGRRCSRSGASWPKSWRASPA
jgi:hypothetical protein